MWYAKERLCLLVSLLALLPAGAFAGESQWYVGGSLGVAWASTLDDITSEDVSRALEVTGLPSQSTPSIVSTSSNDSSFDDFEDIDWKLYAGYQFNDYLGIEALYADLGSFERSARLRGAVALLAPARLVEETEVEGYGLSLVASYPFSSAFSVFAKAGAFSWETDTSGDLAIQTGTVCFIICVPVGSEGTYSIDESGTDPVYGLGLSFSGGNLGLRLEWERFTGLGHGFDSETDMDLVTVGVEYRFGYESEK